MGNTKIEWTEKTWNPITGCTKISEGCQHCYAERMSKRLAGRCGYSKENPFQVTIHKNRLNEPLKWKKPSKIFVCSMGDLFHKDVPDDFIINVIVNTQIAQQHTFLLLTKRPDKAKDIFKLYSEVIEDKWPLPNLWLGVTAENQQRADERIPTLLSIPASVHFVSCEPLLGPINLEWYLRNPDLKAPHWLDWVICGGETGPGARPMHPDWVRSLLDQCQEAGTPFFFKSWGDWEPGKLYDPQPFSQCNIINLDGGELTINGQLMRRVGKRHSGRLLDGVEWNEYPEEVEA